MKLPLVSTIVTCCNYGDFIIPTLESICNQTYRPLECIIVDDCSTDCSVSKIESFLASNSDSGIQFRLVKQSRNSGQLAGFICGIEEAKGSFIHFMDADDILFPEFINTHIQTHLHANTAFTTSLQVCIDGRGELTTCTDGDVTHSSYLSLPEAIPYNELKTRTETGMLSEKYKNIYEVIHADGPLGDWYWNPTTTAVFRKDVLDGFRLEGETEYWRICADRILFNLAHIAGGSCRVCCRLSAYRKHGKNSFSCNGNVGNGCRIRMGVPEEKQRINSDRIYLAESVFRVLRTTCEKPKSNWCCPANFYAAAWHIVMGVPLRFFRKNHPLCLNVLGAESFLQKLFFTFAVWICNPAAQCFYLSRRVLKKLRRVCGGKL